MIGVTVEFKRETRAVLCYLSVSQRFTS